jgi:tetratricopeptide (TPR) repeat protein
MWVISCYWCVSSDDEVQRCIKHLVDKFGDSPRVEVLSGIRMEATEKPEIALEYYNKLLESDPTNSVSTTGITQRLSALTMNNRQRGDERPAPSEIWASWANQLKRSLHCWTRSTTKLMAGWNWQRSIICVTSTALIHPIRSQAHAGFRYNYALQALSHALLLAPQNPFYVLEFAEIAYASGDIHLAIRTFLMVVDMTDDEDAPITSHQTDITFRAWYGVKLVCGIQASQA